MELDARQRAAQRIGVARVLHRAGVGEKLALARDRRLDEARGEQPHRAEREKPGADHRERQVHEAPARLGAVARVVLHHEAADGGQEHDALQRAGGAQVEADVAVQDVAELVRDHCLQLVARELLERAARYNHDRLVRRAPGGEGVDALIREVTPYLPESPFLYPDDEIGTQSLRFFASELVRETALEQLEDEVPYSVACGIEEFREERSPVYIRAVIYVERESQKGILVGHHGARIREIGRASRVKIERLIGKPVFLDLWVKVKQRRYEDAAQSWQDVADQTGLSRSRAYALLREERARLAAGNGHQPTLDLARKTP